MRGTAGNYELPFALCIGLALVAAVLIAVPRRIRVHVLGLEAK